MQPTCAKSCRTESIQFGKVDELRHKARAHVEELHRNGMSEAYLYGAEARIQENRSAYTRKLGPLPRAIREPPSIRRAALRSRFLRRRVNNKPVVKVPAKRNCVSSGQYR